MAKKGSGSKARGQAKWHGATVHGQGHSDPKMVFFGNIPGDMPEAEFRDQVTAKVGEIAEIKLYPPARSWRLISQSCATKYLRF